MKRKITSLMIMLAIVGLSNKTIAQAAMVKDIRSGSLGSNPANLIKFNDTLYFSATAAGGSDTELWKSDGTSAGTVQVKDIYPGNNSFPGKLTVVGSTLFFSATNGTEGTELWKTNGNSAGTILVKDISTGVGNGNPQALTNLNGTLYFSAYDGSSYQLWKTNGTSAGTTKVSTITLNTPSTIAVVNSTLYYSATNGTNGFELWKSDGTSANTMMVKDINPGSGDASIDQLTNVNGTLFFTATDGTNGIELWKSDGTSVGTIMVKDIISYSVSSTPYNLIAVNTTLFFSANDGVNGIELWKSDGTSAGTIMVKDINVGASGIYNLGSDIGFFTNINGTLYFQGKDADNGKELWKSDGTSAGTFMVYDAKSGTGNSDPNNIIDINGVIYFCANDGSDRYLYKTNGTDAGTFFVGDYSFKTVTNLANVNGTLFFQATTTAAGNELWKLPPPTVPTTAPSTLTLTMLSAGDMKLNWAYSSTGIDGFIIERSTDNSTFTKIDSTLYYTLTFTDTTSVVNTLYYYRVAAYNTAGNSPYSNTVSGTAIAGLAPTAPSTLTLTVLSGGGMKLDWTDNSTTEDGFIIERSTDNSTFTKIDSTLANIVTFTDNTGALNTLYYYKVAAYNSNGNSSYSNTVNGTTLAGSTPTAPGTLALTVLSTGGIKLDWADNSTTEDGFIIERSTDNSTFTKIDSTLANIITFTDNTGLANTLYYYKVAAYNSNGNSSYSNTVSGTPLAVYDISMLNFATIYPNPFKDVLTLDIDGRENISIRISNIIGETIYVESFSNSKNHQIHLQDVPNGIYLLQLKAGDKMYYKKLTKE